MEKIDYSEYTDKNINTNELVIAIMKGLGFKKSKTLYTYFYNEEVIATSHYKKMLEKHKNGEKLADNDTIKMLKTLLAIALGIPNIDSIAYNYIENIAFDLGLSEEEIYKCLSKAVSSEDLSAFDEFTRFPALIMSSELTKRHYSILSKLNHHFLKIIPTDDLFGMSVMGSYISGVEIKKQHYSEMAGDFCGCMYMFYTKLLDLCLGKRTDKPTEKPDDKSDDKPTIKPTIKLKKAAKIFLEDLLLQNYYDRIYVPLTKSDLMPNKPCALLRDLSKNRLDKSNIAPCDYNERSHKEITSSQSYKIPFSCELTEAAFIYFESEKLYKDASDEHERFVLNQKMKTNEENLNSIVSKSVKAAFEQDEIKLHASAVLKTALASVFVNHNQMVYQRAGKEYLDMYYPIQIIEDYDLQFIYISTINDFARYYNEMLGETAYVYNMYKAKVDEYKKLEHENEVLKEKLAQLGSNNP